ncbi:galactokinase [Hymenobacter roseosalivarius DSM 11622]|uniref:Galactokinase n=1 Tax=Hymenobacter roseosalivarius DSM 11622 TaxID=645990 RepID=A0A1W1V1J1_9BACT|nr:galactokinase [Hymenobacter roseosalivarius]SMB87227.1 galactokinase [Hymenobacter roseosalivarius DSM 11622]
MLTQSVSAAFQRHFGHASLLVRAPGRVNLIGEHTDYNAGFVLPAAVDKEIHFAVGLNNTDTAHLIAHDLHESCEFSLTEEVKPGEVQWANYIKGVVAQLQRRGLKVPGFDCVFGGNIPIGAGMSSSAAVECGLAFALNKLLGGKFDRLELAHMGQAAEHEFAGVKSGLMDQFASLHGRAGHVIRLDCRSLDYEYFPFDTTAYHLILCNTGVKHSLASSEYNNRRLECEQGVALLQKHYPKVNTLRDATLQQLEEHRAELGDVLYRRCSYVVEENLRVEAACQHLLAGDMPAFGQEMYGSHAGLRDKYEVSCRELDVLVELAKDAPGVLGARMMGGGFGGCTINLVEVAQVENFVERMTAGYQRELNLSLETYQAIIVDGVEAIETVSAGS